MAKLQRKSAKVFAEQAQANVGGIAQFGSLAAGNIQYSKDIDVIQALDAYKQGWQSAVVGNKSPAMEDRNALDYLLSYQQAYIMQHGVPEWLSTETYYQNSYVVDSNGELRTSTIDDNIGNDPAQDLAGQYWGYAGSRGSGKRIGEVYFSQSKLATDNPGALPLFTGDIINNASNIYPEFFAWVSSHTELCVTQEQYTSRINQYGECPFYVVNTTNNTIRLPKLANYIKMANSTNNITQSADGLPNIVGNLETGVRGSISSATGAFSAVGNKVVDWGGTGVQSLYKETRFSASDYNSKYGASTDVTPAHTTVFPWVCAYQTAIPASTAQAAEFLQTMNSKVSVDDLAQAQVVVESYSNGTSWYRVWSDGWCEQGGVTPTGSNGYDTITLLKPYRDTNYSVIMTGRTDTGSTQVGEWSQDTTYPYSTTQFKYYRIAWTSNWVAFGYIDTTAE